jgi:hypothetical protein
VIDGKLLSIFGGNSVAGLDSPETDKLSGQDHEEEHCRGCHQ